MSAAVPEEAGGSETPLLRCADLHAYYGESYVLHGISFEVNRTELLALLGRNGAGKTTTLRAIARAPSPALRRGQIFLAGEPIHGLAAHEAARRGISLVPEDRRIVPGLTVEENLVLAQIAPAAGWPLARIYERFPRLAERRHQEGVTLSGGEQQMLAIARALARDLALLLLDEPYEGLAPHAVAEIETVLAQLKAEGLTIIVVEQNALAALKLADRAVILENGQVVFRGPAGRLLTDAALRREHLAL